MSTRPTTSQRDKLRRLVARSRPACAECGQPINYDADWLDPDAYQLDHRIPLARGGTHTPDNVRATHRSCNRAKSDKDHAPLIRRSGSLG